MLPGGGAAVPEVLQVDSVANRVHRVPEAGVPEGHELALRGESLQRFLFENRRVVGQVIEDAGLEDEEAAIDPRVAGLRLLGEAADHVVFGDFKAAKARGRSDRRDRCQPAVAMVKLEQLPEVKVRKAVAVRRQECLPFEMRPQAPKAAAGHGVESGVNRPDVPVRYGRAHHTAFAGFQVQVPVGVLDRVIAEVVFDEVATVTAGDHELA